MLEIKSLDRVTQDEFVGKYCETDVKPLPKTKHWQNDMDNECSTYTGWKTISILSLSEPPGIMAPFSPVALDQLRAGTRYLYSVHARSSLVARSALVL